MERKEIEAAGRMARRLQKVFGCVSNWGLGVYARAKVGRERMVDTRRGPVRVLEYGFEDEARRPLFIDIHGGGFVLGSADMDETMCLEFRKAGVKVISIDYPKAPDHPYPAAVEAIHDVAAWYVAHGEELGLDTARMAIGGHSAGGNLAAVTCMNDLKAGEFRFRGMVLDYPALDMATEPGDKPHPAGALPLWMCRMFNACYAPEGEAREPGVSPVFAPPGDLVGMPPALVIVCGKDSLHDEAVRFAENLRAAGSAVTVEEYPDQPHGFTYDKYDKPAGRDAIAKMRDFIAAHTA